MTCGIYMIKNKKTGQMYIGQAFDIEKRWTRHIKSGDLKRLKKNVKEKGLPWFKFEEGC